MKKTLTSIVLWLSFIAITHAITFNVTVPAGTKACYVTGEFNKWSDTDALEMTKVDDTHYTLDLPDVTDVSTGFKYLSGPKWDYVEKTSSGVDIKNRTVATENDVIAQWASIYSPTPVVENPLGVFTVIVPENTRKCYVVGNINDWSVENPIEMEAQGNNHFYLDIRNSIDPSLTSVEFKYVNGPNWKYEEKASDGKSTSNRKKATTDDIVMKWGTIYNPLISTETIKFASADREISVLTPPDYKTNTTKRYPVLYMQGVKQSYQKGGEDGANGDDLFGDTSWAVSKTMEKMAKEGKEVGIVVIMYGFINELSPWTNSDFMGSGQGNEYLQNYLNTVIPFVNDKFRTLTGPENTAIAGADIGGLISFYAALKHPEVFGKAGLFSPSFWFNKPELMSYLNSWTKATGQKIYFAIGDKETATIKKDAVEVYQKMAEKGLNNDELILGNYKEGIHNDLSWRNQFENVYSFLLGQAYEAASPEYRFMSDNGKGGVTCDGEAPFSWSAYYSKGAGTSQDVMTYVKVIPSDIRSTYYWNVNVGNDCQGENLKETNQNIGFSSKKSTDTWHRMIIKEDKTLEVISASASHFKVIKAESANGILMTRCKADGTVGEDQSFTLCAEVDFGANKHFEVHYGSVNSGSDMGSLVGTKSTYPLEVPNNCTKAQIIYNFTTNAVTIKPITTETIEYDYLFMSGSDNATCDEQASFEKITYYPANGETPKEAKVYIKEVPADEHSNYYWNINVGKECSGNTFFTANKNIEFKNSKKTISWIRAVIYENLVSEDIAVSSKHFKIIANGKEISMDSETAAYTVSATIDFPTFDKSFEIKYGSVNSGTIMSDALTEGNVSEKCIQAKITYCFKTNQVGVEVLKEGEAKKTITPEITYFRAIPSFCKAGTPVTVSTLVKDNNGYSFSYKVSHNYQTPIEQNYETNASGEMTFQLNNLKTGIYHIILYKVKGDETIKDSICVKVPYEADRQDKEPNKVISAYEEVNWETTGRFKANFHTHTSQSFDTYIPTNEVVDHYQAKGYKILALTDHDYNSFPWTMFNMFNPDAENRDPEQMDMLAFPSIELSKDNQNNWTAANGHEFNHHNDFFTGRKGQEFATLQESYAYTQKLGGLQIINHPGQYWSLNNKYENNINEQNSPAWHANNFKTYASLIGLEVYNQGNRRPNDRILWDQILDRTMPDRPVYGYSCADAHSLDQYFHNYEFMLMEELSLPALKDAMKKGKLFFSYEYSNTGDALAPMIHNIRVDETNQNISIDTPEMDVYWISSTDVSDSEKPETRKSSVVGYGKTFYYKGFQGNYVRALIKNKYGETCTQPFGFISNGGNSVEKTEQAQEPDFMVCPNPARYHTSIISDSEIKEVELISMGGQMIKKFEGNDKTTLDLNVQGINNGIYIVKVKTESFVKSKLIHVMN